jgi:hypothetical protein
MFHDAYCYDSPLFSFFLLILGSDAKNPGGSPISPQTVASDHIHNPIHSRFIIPLPAPAGYRRT